MNDDRLGNLGVLAMEGFSLPLNVDKICKLNITEECVKVFMSVMQYFACLSSCMAIHGGWLLRGRIKGFNSAVYAIKCQEVVIELMIE